MAGLFQAVAVRCGGFQVVVLGALAPAVQVLYLVMMYVDSLSSCTNHDLPRSHFTTVGT